MHYHLLEREKYAVTPHATSSDAFDKLYKTRLRDDKTIVTNLHPLLTGKDYQQTSKYPVFFVNIKPLKEISKLIADNSKKLQHALNTLPTKEKQAFINKLITDGIYITNDIEGVKTSYSDIAKILNLEPVSNVSYKQLSHMVNAYKRFTVANSATIATLKGFRKVYDELTTGLINKDDLPNGKMFRENTNDSTILRIADAWQTVHVPPQTEKEIDKALTELLAFWQKIDMTPIYKALITHFFFENTHPFNDGNGRMGRYLYSNYMVQHYDIVTACSFSQAVANELNIYYKAFRLADREENRGEVTLFMLKIMWLIVQKQNELLLKLIN